MLSRVALSDIDVCEIKRSMSHLGTGMLDLGPFIVIINGFSDSWNVMADSRMTIYSASDARSLRRISTWSRVQFGVDEKEVIRFSATITCGTDAPAAVSAKVLGRLKRQTSIPSV